MTVTFEDVLATCPLRPGPYPAEPQTCHWCGGELPKRRRRWCSKDCADALWRNHAWTGARSAALRRDGRACVRCGARGRLEVNHLTPILGRHAQYGCHHHVDGLETLCHPCHVAETARQFGHRTAAPPDPQLWEAS